MFGCLCFAIGPSCGDAIVVAVVDDVVAVIVDVVSDIVVMELIPGSVGMLLDWVSDVSLSACDLTVLPKQIRELVSVNNQRVAKKTKLQCPWRIVMLLNNMMHYIVSKYNHQITKTKIRKHKVILVKPMSDIITLCIVQYILIIKLSATWTFEYKKQTIPLRMLK